MKAWKVKKKEWPKKPKHPLKPKAHEIGYLGAPATGEDSASEEDDEGWEEDDAESIDEFFNK